MQDAINKRLNKCGMETNVPDVKGIHKIAKFGFVRHIEMFVVKYL